MHRCPECDNPIDADCMNIHEGVALCPGCGKLSRLSELSDSPRSRAEILSDPPHGCSIRSSGNSTIVTASSRSVGGAIAAIAISLFWNGILSVFVLLAFAGLYTNLIGPLPVWFPAPQLNQGRPNMNGQPIELGMAVFLCIFLIPFVTVGAVLISAVILCLFGKVEVALDGENSWAATAIGPARWKRKFDAGQVTSVKYELTAWQSEGQINRQIELSADRIIQLGSLLPRERMEWLRIVLHELLVRSRSSGPV